MSYIDQANGSRRVAIGGVVLLHIAVGYAFITGLAYKVIPRGPDIFYTPLIEDPAPPPPLPPPPPPPTRHASPPETTFDPPPIDVAPTGPFIDTGPRVDVYPPFPKGPDAPPQPPRTSKARDAVAGPSRSTWVTTDDYPSGPLRDGVQGVVAINVAVGTDGRVTGCEVTASSGNDQLDQATCRLYARRARFQPALDADGQPVASHHSDRIRWQIPE